MRRSTKLLLFCALIAIALSAGLIAHAASWSEDWSSHPAWPAMPDGWVWSANDGGGYGTDGPAGSPYYTVAWKVGVLTLRGPPITTGSTVEAYYKSQRTAGGYSGVCDVNGNMQEGFGTAFTVDSEWHVLTGTVPFDGYFCSYNSYGASMFIQGKVTITDNATPTPTATPTHVYHSHYVSPGSSFAFCGHPVHTVSGSIVGADVWAANNLYQFSVVVTETASGNQQWASFNDLGYSHAGFYDAISPTVLLMPQGSQMIQYPCWPDLSFVWGTIFHGAGALSDAGSLTSNPIYLMPVPVAGDLGSLDGAAYLTAGRDAGRWLDGAWATGGSFDQSDLTYFVPYNTRTISIQGMAYQLLAQIKVGETSSDSVRLNWTGLDTLMLPWNGDAALLHLSAPMLWVGRLEFSSQVLQTPTPVTTPSPTPRYTNTPGANCGASTCTPVPGGTTPQPTVPILIGTPGTTPGAPGGPQPVSSTTPRPWIVPTFPPLILGEPTPGAYDSVEDLVALETQEYCYEMRFPWQTRLTLPGGIAPVPDLFAGMPEGFRFCLTCLNRFQLVGFNVLPGLWMLGAALLLVFLLTHVRGR
jgi:hypothetical protein